MRDDSDKASLRIVTRHQTNECPMPVPAYRYGSEKLLPLRQGAAYLSSRFQKDREGLPLEGRTRVDTMLTLFFEPGIGTHLPSPMQMGLEARRFVCQLGTIHYHHSPEHGAPILQCFEFPGPGGGGTPMRLPTAPVVGTASPCNDDVHCGWDRRIAARLNDLMDWRTAPSRQVAIDALWLLRDEAATLTTKERRRTRAHLRGERLLGQIADTVRALCLRLDPAILPGWSLLGQSVQVAEQLDNDFARAIFAGEAVGCLGRSLSLFSDEARSLDLWRRHYQAHAMPIDPRMFYEETLRILRAINSPGGDKSWTRCRYYASLSLADDNLLSDMRCLSIVRSEMIFHFSTILNDYSLRNYEDLAFRYAKFAYFTEISKKFFGIDKDEYPIDYFLIEFKARPFRFPWMSEEILRNIDEYSHMSDAIIERLVGEVRSELTGFEDLCTLASQILLEDRMVCEADEEGADADQV